MEERAANASDLDRGDVLPLRKMLEQRARDQSELALAEATLARESVRNRLFNTDASNKIDRYSVIKRIGRGAMGSVYLAYDGHLDRKVALKIIRRASEDDNASRNLLEARAMARVKHPAVVGIFDVGRFDRWLFLAMEYVGGLSVRQWLSEARRDWREIAEHFAFVGDGLAAAHRAGMSHGDIKLDNLRFSSAGKLRVLDFGLARFAEQSDGEAGTAGGTLGYMAPELLAGQRPGGLSDQFAFCVSLWEALSGERPFPGRSVAEQRVFHRAKLPELRVSGVGSSALRNCLRRGLARSPESRYPNMDQLLEVLGASIRQQRRVRRTASVAAVVGASIGVTSLVVARDERPSCEDVASLEHQLWTADERSAVAGAFLGDAERRTDGRGRRLLAALDTYAHRWAVRSNESCEARDGDEDAASAELLQLRVSCLEGARTGFRALVGALGELEPDGGRQMLMRSGDVTGALADPAACSDASVVMSLGAPASDAQRDDVISVSTDLTLAEVYRRLGNLELASELTATALEEADALRHPPLQAAGYLARGLLLADTGDIEASASHLRISLGHALRGQDNETAAKAAEQLAHIVGYELARPTEGEHWLWIAEEIRLGLPAEARDTAAINSIRAAIQVRAGDYEDAVVSYTQAIADTRRTNEAKQQDSSSDPLLATLHNNLGSALSLLGREGRARRHFASALDIRLRALGNDHPLVGSALRNLGTAEMEAGETSAAQEHLEQALAIQERAYGPDSLRTVYTLTSLSRLHCRAEEFEVGLSLASRGLALQRRELGGDHPVTGECLAVLAHCQIGAGRLDLARTVLVELSGVTEAHPDDWHLQIRSLDLRAAVSMAEGSYAAAAETYDSVAARWREQGRETDAVRASSDAVRARARIEPDP
ncbi:MAG: protein kinase domain-containing protein [Nannocystales bacterium]